MPELQSAESEKVSAVEHCAVVGERRDTERAITLWHKKASETGGLPLITAFDFSRLTSDWGYRFIVAGDSRVEDSVFLVYGTQFARMLELPEKPVSSTAMIEQLPERYRPLFASGCIDALTQAAPARLSGAVVHFGKIELYRAAFMPIRLRLNSLRPLIFGSFNCRTVPRVNTSTAHRRMDGWLVERVRR